MTVTRFQRFLFQSRVCRALDLRPQCSPFAESADPAHVLKQIGLLRGICVVLGDTDGQWSMELARHSELLVYVQLTDAAAVAKARAAAEHAGLDASRLQIELGDLQQVHLADNLADALVVLDATVSTPDAEIMRVLHPRGKMRAG